MTENRKRSLFVYQVMEIGIDHKPKFSWANIDGIKNDGSRLPEDLKPMMFSGDKGKNFLTESPGMIYEIDWVEGSIFPTTGKYVERWKNVEDVAKWHALTRSNQTRLEHLKDEDKEKKKKKIHLDLLEPLREAYWSAPGFQKHLILADIVAYITGYKKG